MNAKAKQKKTVKTSMNDFFTQDNSENGVRVDLVKPNGDETEHFLIIRGMDSTDYRVATVEAMREAKDTLTNLNSLLDKGETVAPVKELEILDEKDLKKTASLIVKWSFDEECKKEDVINFLRKAPHIRDMIEGFAANRANFLTKPSAN